MSARPRTGSIFEARFAVPAVLTLFAAAMPAIGYFAYDYDLKVLSFPLGIGLFAAIMGLLSIGAEWRASENAPETPPASPNLFNESEGLLQNRDTWIQVGWIVLFAAATTVLGFLTGPSLMIALYLKWDGRGWRSAIAAAVLMTAGVWLIATYLIRAPLPLLPVFWS
jgi:hypothetical protein